MKILMRNKFSKKLNEVKVTHIFLPPTAFYDLIDHAQRFKFDTSSLRQILIAAAVATAKLKQGVDHFWSSRGAVLRSG